MLFKRDTLRAIVAGDVTLAFRRWARPSVREGSQLRTAAGVIRVTDIAVTTQRAVSEADAAAAGFASRADLLASLAGRDGALYRIGVRYEGADHRIALRAAAPSRSEIDEIVRRLSRMDVARETPWTERVLSLISDNPAIRAADLAAFLKRETKSFKADVRKLKELGLTVSLDVGYRISPRGKQVLRRLRG